MLENNFQKKEEAFDKNLWWEILSPLISVLRINLFLVSEKSAVLLPPEEFKYGGQFLLDSSLDFNVLIDGKLNIEGFAKEFSYYEYQKLGMHCFILPIKFPTQAGVYLVVGPVCLNTAGNVRDNFVASDVRSVDFPLMDSILDLLREIVKSHFQKDSHNKILSRMIGEEVVEIAQHFSDMAHEIRSAIRIDELLATFLDVGLKMTNADGGSIMLLDPKSKEFVIRASRGVDEEYLENSNIVFGEGISGLVAKSREYCLLESEKSCSSTAMKKLLKRPDIKESLVFPILKNDSVCGILNLHSKEKKVHFKEQLDNLNDLAQLLPAAL